MQKESRFPFFKIFFVSLLFQIRSKVIWKDSYYNKIIQINSKMKK